MGIAIICRLGAGASNAACGGIGRLAAGAAIILAPRGASRCGRQERGRLFSEFAELAEAPTARRVSYGAGAARFAGATYDPTSHYRAAAVFAFFEEQQLTPGRLRELSQHQVGLLASAFDALGADPTVIARDRSLPLSGIGGFLALRTPRTDGLHESLKKRGVMTDYRGAVLRLGPAPYLTDGQLIAGLDALGDALRLA